MCLGVPGKITEIYTAGGLRMGKVDFGGVVREACLEYVPEAEVGNYTVIHVGFAISLLSEEEAPGLVGNHQRAHRPYQRIGSGTGGAMKYVTEYRDAEKVGRGAGRHPRHRHAALGPDGDLRRPDARHRAARN